MSFNINHNAMNHSSPLLDLLSFLCGVVGGVWTMMAAFKPYKSYE
jgi:hypothetical protein